jgi:hypothetical protein
VNSSEWKSTCGSFVRSTVAHRTKSHIILEHIGRTCWMGKGPDSEDLHSFRSATAHAPLTAFLSSLDHSTLHQRLVSSLLSCDRPNSWSWWQVRASFRQLWICFVLKGMEVSLFVWSGPHLQKSFHCSHWFYTRWGHSIQTLVWCMWVRDIDLHFFDVVTKNLTDNPSPQQWRVIKRKDEIGADQSGAHARFDGREMSRTGQIMHQILSFW